MVYNINMEGKYATTRRVAQYGEVWQRIQKKLKNIIILMMMVI